MRRFLPRGTNIPGISNNLSLLEKEAKQIEEGIKQAETESRDLSESMYR